MNRTNLIQGVRLVAMVLAIAGIIYALEFMRGGIAVGSELWACTTRSA